MGVVAFDSQCAVCRAGEYRTLAYVTKSYNDNVMAFTGELCSWTRFSLNSERVQGHSSRVNIVRDTGDMP